MKNHIPNIFTLLNLLSGILGVIMAVSDRLVMATAFVFLGIFFDFFDGFFARKFNVQGEFGKQLDSLADMVTSGVVPGIVMFQMLLYAGKEKWFMQLSCESGSWESFQDTYFYFVPLFGLVIPLAAAYRLANFNIDERQADSFIGLPTPALAIFVMSLPLILHYAEQSLFVQLVQNIWVLLGVTLVGAYLLNAEIPLFSLKFKDYGWKENVVKYVFLLVTAGLLVLFKVVAIPMVITVHVLLSILENKKLRKNI